MTTLRVGICSTAHVHAEVYRDALADLTGATLVGIADDDVDRGRTFADETGTPFREVDGLLEDSDAVVVCSPNATHGEWVERAAAAGVHVLCEKPLATSTADAVSIRDTCASAGVRLGVAMPLRFSPPLRRARSAIEDMDFQFVTGWNRGKMPGGWFVDPDRSGGGAVQDHTVHLVDLVRWFTGADVREVYAETTTAMHDIPVEDVNVLSMELQDGTPFTLDGSWSYPDSAPIWGDAGVELVGREEVVTVEHTAGTLRVNRDGADPPIQLVTYGADATTALVREFLDAVRADRPPAITGDDGVRVVAVVEAAYASVTRAEPMTVEYP